MSPGLLRYLRQGVAVKNPPNLDPALAIKSVFDGRFLSCPDLTSVDDHIRDIQVRIAQSSEPGAVQKLKQDVNALLDRRSYLMLTGATLPELSA